MEERIAPLEEIAEALKLIAEVLERIAMQHWTAIAMAVQCAGRSGLAGDLRRDAAHAGGAEGTDQQDRSQ